MTSEFEPGRCSGPNYLPTFTVYRILVIALELVIPVLLATVGHESYRNRLKRLICLQRRRVLPSNHRYLPKMRNVLGEQVETSHTMDQYFTRLNFSWEVDTSEKAGRKY
ncbi:hypothetical protein PMAYCL1PPCAC_21793 [Pristionchus mayeri]|uniref:G protein-coupled receptor n=1 Tax=Pristionchus mayeri TaxID=1317129 RepID=A0AAN5I488_9BILA|nr:hypothetical protein PMAYCL1PPCAC_21793 [Pristionchus mayeri]